MKSKSYAPLVLMMIFTLVLALSAVAQKRTATANVSETVVFDYEEGRYVSSRDGKVENPYDHAKIVEEGNYFQFQLKIDNDSTHVSEYLVIKRKKNGNVIICKKFNSDQQIKIVQKRHSLNVHTNYVESANRYDGAIIFTNLKFKPSGRL